MKRSGSWLIVLSVLLLSGCQSASPPLSNNGGPGPGADCSAVPEKVLNVAKIRQKGTNWCWAASGEMVMRYYNEPVRQCEQVNELYGLKCCGLIVDPECDKTGWPQFGRHNLQFAQTKESALAWQEIKEQVACKGNPIAFSWKWTGGSGHMMVIKGFSTQDGENYVLVNDPARNPNYEMMLYEKYDESDNHSHWDDFYNFRR